MSLRRKDDWDDALEEAEQNRLRRERELAAADTQVLEAAVKVMSRALADLVGACMDADGKPCAPDRGALLRARSKLPPACTHALQKRPND